MHPVNRVHSKTSAAVAFCLFACLAVTAVPAYAEDEPGEITIPTVFRDSYKITINGKPDANGTFSMVFTPHGEDGTEFTVNVVKGMGAKKIAADVAKELTLAAGSRYKVKQNGKEVVVKKGNKKEKPLAIEMSNQKLTGVSIMIGKN
ncbi:MAG: hypothetical protein OQK55_10065 [Thermoanaerobaculales bacterium]|jgi:hypothetical protein|nr:hypothetical protein [Thermoanaerobaculales bacterium]